MKWIISVNEFEKDFILDSSSWKNSWIFTCYCVASLSLTNLGWSQKEATCCQMKRLPDPVEVAVLPNIEIAPRRKNISTHYTHYDV